MSNYYLTYDIYGSPILTNVPSVYIQHGWGGSSKERANHKYIARIDTPDGYRYFYTQKEIDAYYNKLQKEVSDVKEAYDKYEKRPYITYTTTHMKKKKRHVVYRDSLDSNFKSSNGNSTYYANHKTHTYKDAFAAADQKQQQRKAYITKYQGQLDTYNKSRNGG